MSADRSNPSDEPVISGSPSEDVPSIEDAFEGDDAVEQAAVEEDDPSLLNHSSRTLEASNIDPGSGSQSDVARGAEPVIYGDEGTSDMAMGPTESTAATTAAHAEQTGDWENELSAHSVAVELRRIESELRTLLEERDPKRKRKLSGTARWHELEDDILSWRFSGRFDESTLQRLQELIGRRHYLFNRLRFLASTRPTWNS